MKIKIKHRFSGEVLFSVETESIKLALQIAVGRGADLGEANLRGANLWGANLGEANLREADLREANLWGANLGEANLDFSCWPFSCGSFGAKAGDRLVAQLFCHFARLDTDGCSKEVKAAFKAVLKSKNGCFLKNLFCKLRGDVREI